MSQTIDNLLRQGAHVLYDRVAPVHVHGHASQEELKLMLNLTRPRYFVPVHGEYRHLRAHAQLAWELGAAPDGIFVLEDGDILEIDQNGAAITGSIPAGPIYLDGPTAMDPDSVVLRERRSLARDGVVVVCAGVDSDGELTGPIQVAGSGFMDPADANHAFKRLAEAVEMGVSGDLPAQRPGQGARKYKKSRQAIPAQRPEQAAYDNSGNPGYVTGLRQVVPT